MPATPSAPAETPSAPEPVIEDNPAPEACAPSEDELRRDRLAALLRTEHPVVTALASAPDGLTRQQLDQLDVFNRVRPGVLLNMLRQLHEAGLIRCQDNKWLIAV